MLIEPPHSIDIEQALLGSILTDARCLDAVELLAPEHFFDGMHGDLYRLMHTRHMAGRAVSALSIASEVRDWDRITEDLTVAQYLGRLMAVGNPFEARDYAKTIRDLARRRSLISIGREMVGAASASDASVAHVHQNAEAQLFALAELGTTTREFSFAEAVSDAMARANLAYQHGGGLSGIGTGFADLDFKTGGLQRSDLIVLAGRPSIGKTALATNIAHHVASRIRTQAPPDHHVSAGHVHFFSQEMSKDQLATRMLAERSGVSSDKIRRGSINEGELKRVASVADEMTNLPMTIDETGGISIADLTAKARRVARKHNTTLIVIDYIQLMQSGRRGSNRVQEITEITTGLKALAKELNVPVLALSQLSRQVEQRDDKRPQLSDLRESGSIEQDADMVLFVYRDDYYLDRQEPDPSDFDKHAEWQAKVAAASGKAEVIVAKARHGSVGIVRMAFDAGLTKFSNLAREHQHNWRHAHAD